MSDRKCKDWIKTYLEYSSSSEAPDIFHFWTAVGVIAGALRRHVWIDQKYFQWTPNFYIVFVAPPGIVNKSTTAGIGMKLLRRVSGIKFGPDAVTWQSLIQSLAGAKEEFFDDKEVMHAMSAVTIVSSEFGTFLTPTDREMVDMLVSLWDGQISTFEKHTKTQGSDKVVNPWINLIACTTPSWIAGNFPEYMIGGGFTSRTIFVYGDRKRHLVPYPKDVILPNFHELEDDLVHDLEIMATQLVGEYDLSPAARAFGEEWYKRHYEGNEAAHADDRFAGYIARKQTHMHKLAMVLAAAKRNELIIEESDLRAAEALVTALEQDMPKVFSQINAPEARATNKIVEIVTARGPQTLKELYQKLFHNMSHNDFTEAVKGALEGGLLVREVRGGHTYLKAPKEKEKAHG